MPRGSVAWTARRCGLGAPLDERGPEGLKDTGRKATRRASRRAAARSPRRGTGPERAVHGVVRWRQVDLQRIVAERFGVAYHGARSARSSSGSASHVSARPRHPAKDEETVAAFKKTPTNGMKLA